MNKTTVPTLVGSSMKKDNEDEDRCGSTMERPWNGRRNILTCFKMDLPRSLFRLFQTSIPFCNKQI